MYLFVYISVSAAVHSSDRVALIISEEWFKETWKWSWLTVLHCHVCWEGLRKTITLSGYLISGSSDLGVVEFKVHARTVYEGK